MSVAELINDLLAAGMTVQVYGERLRYTPKTAMTPELLERLTTHKAELLTLLRKRAEAQVVNLSDATAVWQATVDRLENDPDFSEEGIRALRAADVRWVSDDPSPDPPVTQKTSQQYLPQR